MPDFDELKPVPELFGEKTTEAEAAAETESESAASEPQIVYTHDEKSLRELRDEVSELRNLFTRRLMEDRQKTELIKALGDGAAFAFIEPFFYDMICDRRK